NRKRSGTGSPAVSQRGDSGQRADSAAQRPLRAFQGYGSGDLSGCVIGFRAAKSTSGAGRALSRPERTGIGAGASPARMGRAPLPRHLRSRYHVPHGSRNRRSGDRGVAAGRIVGEVETMPKLSITLAQMHIALGDVGRNFRRMQDWAEEAARRGSHLVVFPELWSTGYALEEAKELASALNSGMFTQVTTVATQNKIAIVGSILEKRGVEVANSAGFFAPNGRVMGVYRKIHLFRLFEEDKWLSPGSAPLSIDLP